MIRTIKNISKVIWHGGAIVSGAGWLYVSTQVTPPYPFSNGDPLVLASIGCIGIGYGVWNLNKMRRNRNTTNAS